MKRFLIVLFVILYSTTISANTKILEGWWITIDGLKTFEFSIDDQVVNIWDRITNKAVSYPYKILNQELRLFQEDKLRFSLEIRTQSEKELSFFEKSNNKEYHLTQINPNILEEAEYLRAGFYVEKSTSEFCYYDENHKITEIGNLIIREDEEEWELKEDKGLPVLEVDGIVRYIIYDKNDEFYRAIEFGNTRKSSIIKISRRKNIESTIIGCWKGNLIYRRDNEEIYEIDKSLKLDQKGKGQIKSVDEIHGKSKQNITWEMIYKPAEIIKIVNEFGATEYYQIQSRLEETLDLKKIPETSIHEGNSQMKLKREKKCG